MIIIPAHDSIALISTKQLGLDAEEKLKDQIILPSGTKHF